MTTPSDLRDLNAIRKLSNGFPGRFFYDAERGDLAYIAKACDDKQCDCPPSYNADGDIDCSVSLADPDEIVGERVAAMLNAVPALLDHVAAVEKERDEANARYRQRDEEMSRAKRQRNEVANERDYLRALLKEACGIATRVIADAQVLPSTDSDRIAAIKRAGKVGE